jgi:prevent-host-death family protein
MIRTSAKEARQNFSHLLDQVEQGEEVFVLRRGNIVARIMPYIKPQKKSLPNLKEFRSKLKVKGTSLSEMIIKARSEE